MTAELRDRDPTSQSADDHVPLLPLTRRRLLRTAIAAAVALTLHGSSRPRPAAALDQCSWQTQYTICVNGRHMAYRCEICCAGGVCETVQCIWVDIGPC